MNKTERIPVILDRSVTDPEDAVIEDVYDAVGLQFETNRNNLERAVSEAQAQVDQAKADLAANPRYGELMDQWKQVYRRGKVAIEEMGLTLDQWDTLSAERRALAQVPADAEGVVFRINGDLEEVPFHCIRSAATSGFLWGQVFGFRLGVRLMKLMQAGRLETLPGVDPEALPDTLIGAMADDGLALRFVAQLVGAEIPDDFPTLTPAPVEGGRA